MKNLMILFFILSLPSYANREDTFMNLMDNYLQSLKQQDEKALQKIASPNFIKLLKSNGTLKKSFQKQSDAPYQKKNFDLTFKRRVRDKKESYFVNIKDKSQAKYSDHWYVVKKINDQWLIDDMLFLD